MKTIIFMLCIIVPTCSIVAMEKTTKKVHIRDRDLDTFIQPHITIINQLRDNSSNLLNREIDISDENRIYSYTNQSYVRDGSAISILPGEGIRFALYKYSTLEESKRLGMNNNGDAALVKIYVHAAIKHQLMNLYIGKHSPIKFGDTIIFNLQPDSTIIIKHKNKKLKQTETRHITKCIDSPKVREENNNEPLLLTYANGK